MTRIVDNLRKKLRSPTREILLSLFSRPVLPRSARRGRRGLRELGGCMARRRQRTMAGPRKQTARTARLRTCREVLAEHVSNRG
jgi:hypothetical protein